MRGAARGPQHVDMSSPRPFRFGVVSASARSGDEWIARARHIEALGYSSLVMPDNLRYTLAPVPALAAAAAATQTLRLGTYVLANDLRSPRPPVPPLAAPAAAPQTLRLGTYVLANALRHPVLLAKEVASL